MTEPTNSLPVTSAVDIIKEEYSEGASDVEVCRALGCTLADFKNNYNNNTGFKELVDYGRMLAEAWWLSKGRKNITNKSFNTALWNFNMKNKYGWAEKSEVVSDAPTDQQSLEKMKSELESLLPGVMRKLRPDLRDGQILDFPLKKPNEAD